ncbi:hypothetical protein N7499_008746 [Penicillium canescens]|nr:hypothetical protein N7499_008746 [Penicillium canescens]
MACADCIWFACHVLDISHVRVTSDMLNAISKLRLALGRGLGDALLDLFFGKDLYRVVGKDVAET